MGIFLVKWCLVLSRFFIAFLPRSKQGSFNFLAAFNICSDSGAKENKIYHCFHFFPICLPWREGTRCPDLCLSFEQAFSLSSFTLIKRLFSSSSLSAIKVVSSIFLRLLIFLPAILIPACASSSPAFHVMYSVHKLNKQGDNIQPWGTPFPDWNQSVVSYPVLTVASYLHTAFSGGR